MNEQILAIGTIGFLLIFWFALNRVGEKSDRAFFNTLFSLTIVGVFLSGILDLF